METESNNDINEIAQTKIRIENTPGSDQIVEKQVLNLSRKYFVPSPYFVCLTPVGFR